MTSSNLAKFRKTSMYFFHLNEPTIPNFPLFFVTFMFYNQCWQSSIHATLDLLIILNWSRQVIIANTITLRRFRYMVLMLMLNKYCWLNLRHIENTIRHLWWSIFTKIFNGYKPFTIFAKIFPSHIFGRVLSRLSVNYVSVDWKETCGKRISC